MENIDESVNTMEVAEPSEVVQESGVKEQEVTAPATEETKERDLQRDADFAAMRRALEAEKANNLKITKERDRLAKSLGLYDFRGESADDIADAAEAHYFSKSVDEVRNARIAQETKDMQEKAVKDELEYYRDMEVKRMMDEDLKRIQKIDPTVKSLDELGERFSNFITANVDAVDAFMAIRQADSSNKKSPPPEIGKVNASDKGDKSFYSEAEVDAMIASNSKDLDNPDILAKIRKSMTKW